MVSPNRTNLTCTDLSPEPEAGSAIGRNGQGEVNKCTAREPSQSGSLIFT